MGYAKGFMEILSSSFEIDKRQVASLHDAALAIMQSQSSNLMKIASSMSGKTKLKSKYRRLQRLIHGDSLTLRDYINLINQIFQLEYRLVLQIDRTNWRFGIKEYNLFVLSAIHKGVAIPLIWVDLDRPGLSNTFERFCIVEEFIKYFGVERIKYLLADAEFVGEEWFYYLKSKRIDFVINVRKDLIITPDNDEAMTGENLFKDMRKKSQLVLSGEISGVELTIVSSKNKDGELQILSVNGNFADPVTIYKERWSLEQLFFHMKSDGFNLEETHIKKPNRVFNLFMILSIAACMSYAAGFVCNKKSHVKLKNTAELKLAYLNMA